MKIEDCEECEHGTTVKKSGNVIVTNTEGVTEIASETDF